MYARIGAALVLVASVVPSWAEPMDANEARSFVIGKVFSYTCFEGTRGTGRIYPDGSVAGSIQLRGSGRVHYVRLPPNTVHERGGSVCASVRGLPFQPCFTLDKTSQFTFRGAIYGLSFAYCEFQKRGRRIDLAETSRPPQKQPHPAASLPLRASITAP
jgi:hypothetical protein